MGHPVYPLKWKNTQDNQVIVLLISDLVFLFVFYEASLKIANIHDFEKI